MDSVREVKKHKYNMDVDVDEPIPAKKQKLLQNSEVHTREGEGYCLDKTWTKCSSFRKVAFRQSRKNQQYGKLLSSEKSFDLVSLFAPPIDMIFKGNFTAARTVAQDQKKWLLVNI